MTAKLELCTAGISWHHRMMDALKATEAQARIRYQHDCVRITALKELVTLHEQGQLTDAKWVAITRRIAGGD